jgi:cyclic beta-1,2-glucan synthetase
MSIVAGLGTAWRRLMGPRFAESPWDSDSVIREQLFGPERLVQHAASLASAQEITARPRHRPSLHARLLANERLLRQVYRHMAVSAGRGDELTPAAEWLLDNYHRVEEQLRQVRADLPEGYYRQLPKLARGPFSGYPRVFGIAWACVAHSDSIIEPELLRRFLHAYQEVQPLTIGELWAFAITLRIVLIENLRRVAHGNLDQGASSLTVRNILISMRALSDMNWPDFVEEVSLVDARLRSASNFGDMDFATRNLYRSQIEQIARGAGRSEQQVVSALLRILQQRSHRSARERDPGLYLLRAPRLAFERLLGYRTPWGERLRRWYLSLGAGAYIASVLGIAVAVMLIALIAIRSREQSGSSSIVWQIWLALMAVVPALDIAVALANQVLTRSLRPQILPGLELRDGVPASLRTMVVVPTLLTSRDAIESQLQRLEVHYVASAKGELHFALLSDWLDADSEIIPGDTELLQRAADGISRLNRIYGPGAAGQRFYLFHRRRVWSIDQGRWIGWERKRGKLHELNRLLRGDADTTFITLDGDPIRVPPDVRYVVTLDADTRLPRQTIERLVGKLAHPLNQAAFDADGQRIIDGYAVLQPRVTPSLPAIARGSLFQRVFSSPAGIDPYAAAISDVYQDLTGEGSYAGKGIYAIDAFEAALAGRIPEDTMLSHDLFEGTFARAGLASDIELVEDFPQRYDVAAMRSHRWARGDWQLLPWIFSRSPMPLIGRWKMLDNLRRTLSAPACVLALLTGWLLPLPAAYLWTGFLLLSIALPGLLAVLTALVPARARIVVSSHWRALRHDAWLAMLQVSLSICFLAHQAWLMGDAIVRTVYRLRISRRNLLEWVTAAQAQLLAQERGAGFYRRMSASVVLALIVAAALFPEARPTRWLALPIILAWLLAPAIARRISLDADTGRAAPASAEDAQVLRLIARRTWRYFEAFVTPGDNRLPPDNFQEDPRPVLAHRTSPTNIGLYLLSLVSARDFGWIGTLETAELLAGTLGSMHRMPRFHGHFYNWYDTRNLRPLPPLYISSVDSGNLAAHLVAVAHACRGWVGEPVDVLTAARGIDDALRLTLQALDTLARGRRIDARLQERFERAAMALTGSLAAVSELAGDPLTAMGPCESSSAMLADVAEALAAEFGELADAQDVLFWARAAHYSAQSWRRDARQSEDGLRTLHRRLIAIETAAQELALEMDFEFLLDADRRLLSIGYRTLEGSLDPGCYDLLASEARLASFFAIAKNDVPVSHWFRLGRALTPIGDGAALISWSGSMFEYLMPALVLREPEGSLLAQTERLVVQQQIAHAAALNIPWGMSESAYGARDLELTYQYSNFGIPELGLKRGLAENVVIAPYATALAAMIDPSAAVRNFKALQQSGALGRYGFYEALDYTAARRGERESVVMVRAYMAHHQGMSIAAIANALFDGRLRSRFHRDLNVQATELLLQERAPREVISRLPAS